MASKQILDKREWFARQEMERLAGEVQTLKLPIEPYVPQHRFPDVERVEMLEYSVKLQGVLIEEIKKTRSNRKSRIAKTVQRLAQWGY